MAQEVLDIIWPHGGTSKRMGFQQQEPFSCPDALNVRGTDVFKRRLRGGSRPGIVQILPPKSLVTPPIESGHLEIAATKDTKVHADQATTNFGTAANLDFGLLAGRVSRSFLHFDLGDVPDGITTFTTAILGLYGFGTGTTESGRVCRMTQTGWVETQATWNVYATATNWATAGGDFTATDQVTFQIPVSSSTWLYITGMETLAADAIANRSDQLHVAVKSNNEATACRFRANSSEFGAGGNPVLVLEWGEVSGGVSAPMAGDEIRLLNTCRTLSTSTVTTYTDDFTGSSMSSDWADGGWTLGGSASDGLPVVENGYANTDANPIPNLKTAVLDDQMPSTQSFREVLLVAASGLDTKHYLMLDMDDTTPNPDVGGMMAIFYRPSGGEDANLLLYKDGELQRTGVIPSAYITSFGQSWSLKLSVNGVNWVQASWGGGSAAPFTTGFAMTEGYNAEGGRVGFALQKLTSSGKCQADRFTFYHSASAGGLPNPMLVASAGGALFRESTAGTMVQVSTDLTLASDRLLSSANRLEKLYIADYGLRTHSTGGTATTDTATPGVLTDPGADFTTDGVDADDDLLEIISGSWATDSGVGTYPITAVTDSTHISVSGQISTEAGTGVTYRIVRAPKVFDSAALTLTRLTAGIDTGDDGASAGFVPAGATIVAAWLDRLIWSGDPLNPHVVYASKAGFPRNYGYANDTTDAAFFLGAAEDSSQIGDAVTALIPHGDDYLIIGCKRSVSIVRGDPTYGGTVNLISREVGILDKKAYCYTPEGFLVAMTDDGLYLFTPSPGIAPQRLSRERLPNELLAIDTTLYDVQLEYDLTRQGINIYVVAKTPTVTAHWWFDWATKAFYPDSMTSDQEPTATCTHSVGGTGPRVVILGSRDGYLRVYDDNVPNDDGVDFSSNVLIGPIALGGNGHSDGMLLEVIGQLAEDSGDVTCEIKIGDSIEDAYNDSQSAEDSFVFTAGKNPTWRPRLRGSACFIRLSSEDGDAWAMEQLTIVRERLGKQRLI